MSQNASSAISARQHSATPDFTLSSYRALLRWLGQTHEFVTFAQYDAEPKAAGRLVLLRHDVDYSLDDALQMARIEAELGVQATYFLLFSSATYNLLEPGSIQAPGMLRELGHEVGLHYDVAAIAKAAGSSHDMLAAQCQLLGELCGAEIGSIAMHNPSLGGEDIFRDAPYRNAYDARFCEAYYSDSCMAWRDNFAVAFQSGEFPREFQLLIHPCLWTERKLARGQKIDRLFARVEDEMRAQQLAVEAIWSNHSGVAQHDARERALSILAKKLAG